MIKSIISSFLLISLVSSLQLSAQEVTIQKKVDTLSETENKKRLSPIYVLDGKIVLDINEITPTMIEKMEVLKGENATSLYGQKAKNGVIVITTKQKKAPLKKSDKKQETIILVDGNKISIDGEEVGQEDERLLNIKGIKVQPSWVQTPTNNAFLGVVTEIQVKGDKILHGAKIIEISDESPAAKNGLRIGDLITGVNKDTIHHPEDLFKAIGKYQPNDKVTIYFERNEKSMNVVLSLAENKNKPSIQNFEFKGPVPLEKDNELFNGRKPFNFSIPRMPGMEGMLDKIEKREKLGISVEDIATGKGVKVTKLTPNSPAANAGIQVGDTLTLFNGSPINDVNYMKLQYFRPGKTYQIGLERKGEKKTVEVKMPKQINAADL